MNTLTNKLSKVVGISSLFAALTLLPFSGIASGVGSQNTSMANLIAQHIVTKPAASIASNIQLTHGGHGRHGHGGWRRGWHGGWHGGGWHGGGVRIYWSPWLLHRPGYYYNKRFCQKRCWWKHGQRKCYVRCYRR